MSFNLADKKEKIKSVLNDLFIPLVVVLAVISAFGLGKLSEITGKKTPITVESTANLLSAVPMSSPDASPARTREEKLFVASKSGTKYHFPWCPGAQSIKEENKVWFNTKEEAEKAGYQPASNCKGL